MGLKTYFFFLEFLQPLTIYIFFFRWGMSNKQTLDNKSISKWESLLAFTAYAAGSI